MEEDAIKELVDNMLMGEDTIRVLVGNILVGEDAIRVLVEPDNTREKEGDHTRVRVLAEGVTWSRIFML